MLLGGTFDPVHTGHVDIASHFCRLFHACQLRIVPAGNPWQKPPLFATSAQRSRMLELAFESASLPFELDSQEIVRQGASYTIDTLRAVRKEVGFGPSLVLVMGSDQLVNLHTWREWEKLFDYAHLAVAKRVGSAVSPADVDDEVGRVFFPRLALPHDIRRTSFGRTCLSEEVFVDVSSTEIRKNIHEANAAELLIPPAVLDYIKTNKLYMQDINGYQTTPGNCY